MPIKKLMPIEEWIRIKGGLDEQLQEVIQRSEEEPVAGSFLVSLRPMHIFHKGYVWFFKGYLYDVEDIKKRYKYNDEQIQLLILEHYDKERGKFERLRRRYKSKAIQRESRRRERIPEHVRIAVWRRDGGKCVRCGSRENLEYDHIIPVSKGGSNTARNIELLCERCNREKRDRIE